MVSGEEQTVLRLIETDVLGRMVRRPDDFEVVDAGADDPPAVEGAGPSIAWSWLGALRVNLRFQRSEDHEKVKMLLLNYPG